MHFRANQLSYHFPLLKMVNNGTVHEDMRRFLLIEHPDLISKDDAKDNPLIHLACRYGSYEMLAIALDILGETARTLVQQTVVDGWTPLHLSAYYGDEAMARVLLDLLGEKAPQYVHQPLQDGSSCTPLYLAICQSNTAVVKVLLKAASANNLEGVKLLLKDGWSVFHMAVELGDPEMLAALIDAVGYEHACEIAKMPLKDGLNLLHLAALSNDVEMTEIVLKLLGDSSYELAQVSMPSLNGATPLNLAIQKGLTSMVLGLLEALKDQAAAQCMRKMDNRWSALHQIAYFGNLLMLEKVLEILGDQAQSLIMQPMTFLGHITPLHMVVNRNNVGMTQALLKSLDKDHLKDLLNFPSNDGSTPLLLAKRYDNPAMLQAFAEVQMVV